MQINPPLLKPEKISLPSLLLVPGIVLALLAAGSYLGLKWMLPAGRGGLIFNQSNGGWRQLPRPAGYAETLRISSGGTVWLRTWGQDGLSRWDGAVWRHYHTDLGSKNNYTDNDFALDGEEVWVPTDEGVQHWDGERWQSYREAPSKGASIVAEGGQVWLIDSSGNFSHFKGGRWESHKLALPGMHWPEGRSAVSPRIARTADGAVWFAHDGIWRFDGANWAPVTGGSDHLKDAYLIGAAGNRLWIADSESLRSVSMDGRDWTLYTRAETGLAKDFFFRDVASAGSRTWFATDQGLLEFDGSLWRLLPIPVPGVSGIRRVTAGPDGALWIIGSPPQRSWRTVKYVSYLTVLMLLAVLGVGIWTFWRIGRWRLQQHQRVTQALQHATGDVPVELEQAEQRLAQSHSWPGRITITAVYFGAIAAYVVIPLVWPKARVWPIPVIVLAIHLAKILRESLVRRKPKPSDPIGPGAPSRYDWGKTRKALAGGLLLLAICYADRIPVLKFLQVTHFGSCC